MSHLINYDTITHIKLDKLSTQSMIQLRQLAKNLGIKLSLSGFGQPLSNVILVDNIPDSFHIIRSHICVLQIVSMFPYINPKQWDQT